MKFDDSARSRAPALALTSMLDVIFLLLCFFVTVSVFSQWESEISIKLPTAATGEQPLKDDITLAREIWEKLPAEKLQTFANTIIRHCVAHCSPLLPNGTLTILLIDDEGTIYSL